MGKEVLRLPVVGSLHILGFPFPAALAESPLFREPCQGKLFTYNPVENPKRCKKLSPLFSHMQTSGNVLTFSFISNIRLYNLFRTPGIKSIHPVQFINSLIPKCISSYPWDAPKRATRNAAKTADQLSKGPRHHDSGAQRWFSPPANVCEVVNGGLCINGETYSEDDRVVDSNLLAGFYNSYHRRLPLLLLEPESPPLCSNPPRSAEPAFPPPLGSSRLLLPELSLPISLIWKRSGSSSASYAPAGLVKLYRPLALSLPLPLPLPLSIKLELEPVCGVDTPRPPLFPSLGRYGGCIEPAERPRGTCWGSVSCISSEEDTCRDIAVSEMWGAGWRRRGEGDDVEGTFSAVWPSASNALKLGGSRSSAPKLILR